jgi:hypothetical protein
VRRYTIPPVRAVLWAVLVNLGAASMASAQAAPAAPAPSGAATAPRATFLPRADFTFVWAGLITSDPRFDWQGQLHYDVDITDYGRGRVRFIGGYEATLGRERHRYDLNQGLFLFEASASDRTRFGEIEAVISHASRHLVDRENQPAISWNELGGRIRGNPTFGKTRVDAQWRTTFAMQQAYVDYRWTSGVELELRRPVTPHVEIGAQAAGLLIGVNEAIAHRDRQCGARIEANLRVNGTRGALELFAGYERRIDAYATDRHRTRYFLLGFRLTSEQ